MDKYAHEFSILSKIYAKKNENNSKLEKVKIEIKNNGQSL